MSILFTASPQGWPLALVNASHDGVAPSGHVAFETWEAVWAWKDANEDKRPTVPSQPDPVPSEVPAWKIVQVLKKRQHYDPLNAFILAMNGPEAPAIQARWEFSDVFPRDGKAVDTLLNAALGYTSAQADDLFIEANAIP